MLSLKVVRRGLRTELCKVVGASEKDSNQSFIFLSAELFGREGGGDFKVYLNLPGGSRHIYLIILLSKFKKFEFSRRG